MKTFIYYMVFLSGLPFLTVPALANDLNDGISSYTDDKISDADQLGAPDVNFSFIEVRAKARAGMLTSSANASKIEGEIEGALDSSLNSSQNGNINSVILYPGTTVYGDIIIVDTSTGNKTQLVFGDNYSSSVGSDLDIEDSLNQIGDIK